MTENIQTNEILKEIAHWAREIAYAMPANAAKPYAPVSMTNPAFPLRVNYVTDREFYAAVDNYNGCPMP